MSLIDEVRAVCARLAPHGWAGLLREHGLDIEAADIAAELAKELPDVRRGLKGFEDFTLDGRRGIEPGHPDRSLLFHALASPNVLVGAGGAALKEFPTLAELESVENYVYGVRPPTLGELRARAGGADLAVAVFTHEYRPADHTCHKRHADMVFSRTGVARVGNTPALYNARRRGFLPNVDGDPFGLRALPARYAAYVAVLRRGDKAFFCPLNFHEVNAPAGFDKDTIGDAKREFWQPLHKLFPGPECLADFPGGLQLELGSLHVNEKLKRIHTILGKPPGPGQPKPDTGVAGFDLNRPPFRFEEGIAELSTAPGDGRGLLVPLPHPLIEEARDATGRVVSFIVPKNSQNWLSTSFMIKGELNGARPAPEFVNVRRRVEADGTITDLNDAPGVEAAVRKGGYRALHFVDYTADGWIEARCPQLDAPALKLKGNFAAYSLVTAPDFFPTCDQRELTEWAATLAGNLRDLVWQVVPHNLSDIRLPANLQLPGKKFNKGETSMTAIVSKFGEVSAKQTNAKPADAQRHSSLPDDAAGVFDPGWDISRDVFQNTLHMASYGLGSPFPEDAKLCAALSTFWPAAAPDITRTISPSPGWPPVTVSPLTDEEIGSTGDLPWDGIRGPRLVKSGGQTFAEYTSFAYADYVETAERGQFSIAVIGHIDREQYKLRVLSMALAYLAIGGAREDWLILSFRAVSPGDPELLKAQQATVNLPGAVFRFEVFRNGAFKASPASASDPQAFRKLRVPVTERRTLLIDPANTIALTRKPGGKWERAQIPL